MLVASAAALPLLLGVAGCRSSDVFAGPDPLAGRPPLGRDVLTLQAVIAAEENMIDLYRAAISGDSGTSAADLVRRLATMPPALAQLFASIAASDATHVTVLGG